MLTPSETRPYGLMVWRRPNVWGQGTLLYVAETQVATNQRYCLRAYQAGPGTTEEMLPAPLILEEIVIYLQVLGIIPADWATTVRIKRYKRGKRTSKAVYPHTDPRFYRGEGDDPGFIVLYSLASLAMFSVETPEGIWEHFALDPGTLMLMPANLEHFVSEPLTDEVRYLMFIGRDKTMVWADCDFDPTWEVPGCSMAHIHSRAA
jgi:hypothetical protein